MKNKNHIAIIFLHLLILFSVMLLASCGKHEVKHKSDAMIMALKGSLKKITEWQYDSNDSGFVDTATKTIFCVCQFDQNGNLLDECYWDSTGTQRKMHLTHEFNSNNIPIKECEYWGDKPTFITQYKCDENGNITEEIHKLPDNRISFIVYKNYDGNGNMITDKVEVINAVSGCRTPCKDSFGYDGNGFLISQYYLKDSGNAFFYQQKPTLWSLDKNGNQISVCYGMETTFLYSYVFDKIGNWTRKIEYQMDNGTKKETSIIIRRIEYY